MESANANEKIKIEGGKKTQNLLKSEQSGTLLDLESSGDGAQHLVPGSGRVVAGEELREVGIFPVIPHPPRL